MHWEHVFGSKYLVFFGIFPPPLTYWEYIIFLAETISLAHLTSIPSPRFGKKTLFWCHFASPLSVLVRRKM